MAAYLRPSGVPPSPAGRRLAGLTIGWTVALTSRLPNKRVATYFLFDLHVLIVKRVMAASKQAATKRPRTPFFDDSHLFAVRYLQQSTRVIHVVL